MGKGALCPATVGKCKGGIFVCQVTSSGLNDVTGCETAVDSASFASGLKQLVYLGHAAALSSHLWKHGLT
jgi:hypothetical protein